MRTRRYRYTEEGSPYDLSISDLMAALCCVFVLVTVSIVASLKEKNVVADRYQELQHELYLDLREALGADLQKWGATIDPDTLAVRFPSDAGFVAYKAELRPRYEEILREFFPRLVAVLERDRYRPVIDEIRIEGFTAPDSNDPDGEGSEHDYVTGIQLSQERTMNVLLYCLENTDYTADKEWVRTHIVSNGYSLSRPVMKDGQPGVVDKDASRRVEFRIKTNADTVVRQLQRR